MGDASFQNAEMSAKDIEKCRRFCISRDTSSQNAELSTKLCDGDDSYAFREIRPLKTQNCLQRKSKNDGNSAFGRCVV